MHTPHILWALVCALVAGGLTRNVDAWWTAPVLFLLLWAAVILVNSIVVNRRRR